MRKQDGLEKETVQGMKEDKRRRGRPRDRWMDRPRVEADDAAGADRTRRGWHVTETRKVADLTRPKTNSQLKREHDICRNRPIHKHRKQTHT